MRSLLRRIVPAPIRRALRAMMSAPAPEAARPVSAGYVPIPPGDVARVAAQLADAWQSPSIPRAQLEVAEAELGRFERHEPVAVFDVFVDMLSRIPDVGRLSLLEVGCASGYYADVLRLREFATAYAGCDYSPALIDLARTRHPKTPLEVQDATRLTYRDGAYDIVVSGCCILHIPDYAAAIRESARVARKYVLFHRTPVLHTSPTTHYRKLAYGVECVETHFNETELLRLFRSAGLHLVDAATVSVGGPAPPGDVHVVKSYLCEKR